MHELSQKVAHATRAVSHHPKTLNVYVESKHSKRSFFLGMLVGAVGAAYIVFKQSKAAREELAERVEALKTAAQERAAEKIERSKPKVQETLDRASEVVSSEEANPKDKDSSSRRRSRS